MPEDDQLAARCFEQQFEAKTVERIRTLLLRLSALRLRNVSRYYAVDLFLCLNAGALLGALHVACSLLEVFVRELVIELRQREVPPEANLQKEIEEMRELGFKQLVQELETAGVFTGDDAKQACDFYDKVRIPIHHGLPRRFVQKNSTLLEQKELIGKLFDFDLSDPTVGLQDFEDVGEQTALSIIETAVGLIERNFSQN